MEYPEWITPPKLGVFSQDYSFELNPLVIKYSANPSSSISVINGSLPDGLRLETTGNEIKLLGVCVATANDINARITLRILQTNGNVSDRTYFITLTTVPLAPDWAGQNTFLGYQNNTLPQSYQLTAVPPLGQYVTYSVESVSVVPPVPVMVNINGTTGVLDCDAANVIINNTVVEVTIRAQADLYRDITCSLEVITIDGTPEWITPAGSLGSYAGLDFIEINLLAKDLNDQTVLYNLVSNPNNINLQVAPDGLLYGRVSDVLNETHYSFTVAATNAQGSSYRTFIITVIPSTAYSLLKWTTDSNLGSINEGAYYTIPVVATTQRNKLIIYNLTGGMMPPNMTVAKTDGAIEGFCEYHAVPKLYSFNISADDGYQTIVKQFNLQVNKVYGDIFFGLSIPIMGNERLAWLNEAGNIRVREPGTKTFDTFSTVDYQPQLNIIKGVLTDFDNDQDIFGQLDPWLHQLDLQFGSASNSIISSNNTVVYRNIKDNQIGANLTVFSSAVSNTNVFTNGVVYPISIENLRREIITNRQYINSGSGYGVTLLPVLDWSTGSISSVTVVNPGQNFTSPPTIKVNGSGTNADVAAVLGLVQLNIVDAGTDWTIGDIIEIKIGRYAAPARITVTNIGIYGQISSWSLDFNGDYQQVPVINQVTFRKNSTTYVTVLLTWGVVAVNVLQPGENYQNAISFDLTGSEILPWWQDIYIPAITVGNINGISGSTATTTLNNVNSIIYGSKWQPNYVVFNWEGIRWLGSATFDEEITTFDGDMTRLEDTESIYQTIFDDKMTYFDSSYTIFDYQDPLEYDIPFVYGTTTFDTLLTTTEFYATRYDQSFPKKNSNTLYKKLIRVNNRTYSGNNAVW
jgi:hypothetical protein